VAEPVTLDRLADLTVSEQEELRALSAAVYPPEEAQDWPGRRLEWSPAQWCVRVRAADGTLVSYVGIVVREARHDGRPVRVGGIGGVKTHPAARRRGLAARAVRRAIEFFGEEANVDFGLLVCEPRLLEYYGGLGWRAFGGRVMTRQHGAPAEFTFNRVMTCAVRAPAPVTGTIDLMGPAW
jgi:aminoglycoside 2'-N-acetyltransferase I